MPPDCNAVENRPAELLRYKWTRPIVRVLAEEAHRFNELKRVVGDAPPNVLSERLKQLESADVVSRTVEETTPPSVRYELTDRGHELAGILEELERL